jgi:hypothetical protein
VRKEKVFVVATLYLAHSISVSKCILSTAEAPPPSKKRKQIIKTTVA